jgi:lipoprotein-anchoring transpeptidase ErfK/SrfK
MKSRHIFLCSLILFSIIAGTAAADSRKQVSPCKVSHPSDEQVDWECRRIKTKDTPESLFGDQWRDVLRFNRVDRRHLYPGFTLKVPKNLADVAEFTPMSETYPEAANDEKFILIDLSEQFLGAYEFGRLAFSFPIASGDRKNKTPTGQFRIDAFSRNHESSLYKIEKTTIPYPMHYALRFHINSRDVAFWIHGRDLPGYPASHGCVGLYDEEMQKRYYRNPVMPLLEDARTLYEWVIGNTADTGKVTLLKNGPRVEIVGASPI